MVRRLFLYSYLSFSVIIELLFNGCCEKTFLPEVSTGELKYISDIQAVCTGSLEDDGGEDIFFLGISWSSDTINWTSGTAVFTGYSDFVGSDSPFTFTCSLTGLVPESQYYCRAYATNRNGTTYGKTISFHTTLPASASSIELNPAVTYNSVTDREGNTYKTVTIGEQTWMAENLRSITYFNGNSIPYETGFIWYNDDPAANRNTYGALYTRAVAVTGDICPTGWRVPAIYDWENLYKYLGAYTIAGGKLKENGTSHWLAPNTGANNMTGFTALPGGTKGGEGTGYLYLGTRGFYWSTSSQTNKQAGINITRNASVGFTSSSEEILINWNLGYPSFQSIRCIKNY